MAFRRDPVTGRPPHSAVLVSPKRERRKDRGLRRAAARGRVTEDRDARCTEVKQKADALSAERHAVPREKK